MLARMNQYMFNNVAVPLCCGAAVITLDSVDDGSDFHEIGACAGDEQEFHRIIS